MRALIYRGIGKMALEERQQPKLQAPSDAIIKMVKTTICGTDLHLLKGDLASCELGRTLGHEGIGIVDSVCTGVVTFKLSDRVLITCITSCGNCEYFGRGIYTHCVTGG